jgi:hypothetical protein
MLSLAAMIVCTIALAQNEYKKSPTIGIQFVLSDFKTAADIRNIGMAGVINAKQWSKTNRMVSGLAFSYIQGMSNYVDFAATLTGSFTDYPVPNKVSNGQQKLWLEATATANLKLVPDKYCFVPFLTLGVGASETKGYYGAFVPVGLGLQIKVVENTFMLLNAQYRMPISENEAYHFYYGFGIAQSFNKKKAEPPAEVIVPSGGIR